MTASVFDGTAIIYADSGGKLAVVDLETQAIELVSKYGGTKHRGSVPIDDLVRMVDPQGTTYQRVKADVYF